MKIFSGIYFVLLSALLVLCPSVGAMEQLDPEFGVNGVLTTGFSIYNDEAYAIAVQKDGKILVAGYTDNGADTDLAVVRYNSDGTLDSTFNHTGKVTLAVGSGDETAYGLVVQADGKILLAGTSSNGADKDMILVRLNSDGLLDSDFDDDGKVIIDLSSGDDVASDLVVQADGKIVVAGVSQQESSPRVTLVRLHHDGSLDSDFGVDGVALDSRNEESVAYAVALQADGKILCTGSAKVDGQTQVGVFRFLSSGSADSSFGAGGAVFVAVEEGAAIAYDLAVQQDQKILLTGSSQDGPYRHVLLMRLLQGGEMDAEFGDSGAFVSDLGYDAVGYALAVQQDGAVFVAGYGLSGEKKDIALLTYDVNGVPVGQSVGGGELTEAGMAAPLSGSLVASSDTAAVLENQEYAAVPTVLLSDVESLDDVGQAVFIQEDGRILVAGSADTGKDTDFVLLRYSTVGSYALLTSGGIFYPGQYYYVSTTPISLITRTSAATGGYIGIFASTTGDNDEQATVVARGVCYGITSAPSVQDFTAEEVVVPSDSGLDEGAGTIVSKEISYNLVREGCTENGSDKGQFRSDILRLTPDTLYFVRAYATLSDNTILYGNELSFQTEDACFVATAAYGSPMESQVAVLRQFRDRYLKQTVFGRSLISLYYRYSPPLAELISRHEGLRKTARVFLTPFVWLCSAAMGM